MTPSEKAVFDILWKSECYNGITHADIDECRPGGRYDMGPRVGQYEKKAREIVSALSVVQSAAMIEALRPFIPAYEAYTQTMREFQIEGETWAEQSGSHSERKDAAEEESYEALTKVTFDDLRRVHDLYSELQRKR